MKLFTQKQLQQLQTNLKRKDGIAYVKLFNPSGPGTWYISEIRKTPEYTEAFGVADLGYGTPEMGYFSIDEITKLSFPPFMLGVERDKWFDPMPLTEILSKLKKSEAV